MPIHILMAIFQVIPSQDQAFQKKENKLNVKDLFLKIKILIWFFKTTEKQTQVFLLDCSCSQPHSMQPSSARHKAGKWVFLMLELLFVLRQKRLSGCLGSLSAAPPTGLWNSKGVSWGCKQAWHLEHLQRAEKNQKQLSPPLPALCIIWIESGP